MKGKVTAACPTNIGSKGILSRWRTLSKGLSSSDRTGFLRRRSCNRSTCGGSDAEKRDEEWAPETRDGFA